MVQIACTSPSPCIPKTVPTPLRSRAALQEGRCNCGAVRHGTCIVSPAQTARGPGTPGPVRSPHTQRDTQWKGMNLSPRGSSPSQGSTRRVQQKHCRAKRPFLVAVPLLFLLAQSLPPLFVLQQPPLPLPPPLPRSGPPLSESCQSSLRAPRLPSRFLLHPLVCWSPLPPPRFQAPQPPPPQAPLPPPRFQAPQPQQFQTPPPPRSLRAPLPPLRFQVLPLPQAPQ
mmetsp:Transcript_46486/g.91754  ORF Transcript_46486/g.91754 Transcript_46486/m.91754 type:complete len:226 (-) Transcript_46486:269-946(-)